jgi:hypothetical protein
LKTLTRTYYILLSSFLIVLCCLLGTCEETPQPRAYPRVNSLPVTNITEEGATFNADLFSLGTETITEYGFVWGTTNNPSLNDDRRILPGIPSGTGVFSTEITTALTEGLEYTVKPYIITEEHTVYGKPVTFISLGSLAPEITGFEPDSATWNDTLIIRGKNFSRISSNNLVRLNQIECFSIRSTDTTVFLRVPINLIEKISTISVEVSKMLYTYNKKYFTLLLPQVTGIFPTHAAWNDTIIIAGKNFDTESRSNIITCKIGGTSSKVISIKPDTLKVVTPDNITKISNPVTIQVNAKDFSSPVNLTLISPPLFITKISPKEGTWGTVITLKGRFFIPISRNVITFGGTSARMLSGNTDSIKVEVPIIASNKKYSIINTVTPYTFVSPDTFQLFDFVPVIESITPSEGVVGESVVITGKYFLNPSVFFGSGTAGIRSSSTITRIICIVPGGLSNGPVNISVRVNSLTTVCNDCFIIKNPEIYDIYPVSGTFNDKITIEGANLTHPLFMTNIYFGDISATIISASENKLVVKVPLDIDSIPRRLKIKISSFSYLSAKTFILDPPEILSFQPSQFLPGDEITVYGNGFCPGSTTLNKLYIDSYPLTILSSTSSEIKAKIPYNIPKGVSKLIIKTGKYTRSFPLNFVFRSAWTNIPVLTSLNWYSGTGLNQAGIAFSLSGKGYLMDYYNAKMTSFDPTTREFTDLGVHEIFKGKSGLTCMVNRDTAYLIGGSLGIFRYDVPTNSWISLGIAPTTYLDGVAFALNGELYFGLTFNRSSYYLNKSFWVYNLNTKTWTAKNDFPFPSSDNYSLPYVSSYFSLNNKGYALVATNEFYEYDPDSDSWFALPSLPISTNSRVGTASFIIDNKLYVGTGLYSSTYFDDFWVFDSETSTWQKSSDKIPNGGRYYSIYFVVNNKAYIGFGYNSSIKKNDFYEYNPNYLLK